MTNALTKASLVDINDIILYSTAVVVQGLAANYAVTFLRGAVKLSNTQFVEIIRDKVRDENSENAQATSDTFSDLSDILRKFYNIYNASLSFNPFPLDQIHKITPIDELLAPQDKICAFFGKMIHGNDGAKSKSISEEDIWNMANDVMHIIDNPLTTNKLTTILRKLELQDCSEGGFGEKEYLRFIEVADPNGPYLAFAKESDKKVSLANGEDANEYELL